MSVNWGLGAPVQDLGQTVDRTFQQFNQMQQKAQMQGAMRALAGNPEDTEALGALMAVNPEAGLRFQQMGLQRQEADQKRAALAARQGAGALYASGDTKGARNAALQAGEFEIANQFMQLDEGAQKLVATKYKVAAPLLLKVSELPYEQRRPFIMAAAPQLLAQGWTQEELEGFDPTDQNVQAVTSAAMTVEQVLESGQVKWISGDWGAFATDSRGRPVQPGFAGAPASAPQAAPQGQAASGFDAFHSGWLAGAEGGYAASDGRSGAPVNFGVNQKANPDINVAQLTPEGAKKILHDRYWVPSGADKITDPALQAIHGDTAVNMGVNRAKEFLARSKGDPNAYLALREQFYQRLGGPDLPGWQKRNENLRQYAMGGGATAAPAAQMGSPSIQQQAASGVIQAGQKAPPGFEWDGAGGLRAIPGGPGDKSNETKTDTRKEVTQLRQEFNGLPQVKEWQAIRSATLKIQALANNVPDGSPGRAQADMGLIFSYMKSLDPTSAVRETEYATAQNAAGVPERIRNYFNAARNGQKLSPEQRSGMVRAAEDLYQTQSRVYNDIARQYRPLFQELGVDPRGHAPLAGAGDQKPRTGSSGKPAGAPVQIRVISRKKVN